jgi:hypothetical protein
MLGFADEEGLRPVYQDLADEVLRQGERFERLLAASEAVALESADMQR